MADDRMGNLLWVVLGAGGIGLAIWYFQKQKQQKAQVYIPSTTQPSISYTPSTTTQYPAQSYPYYNVPQTPVVQEGFTYKDEHWALTMPWQAIIGGISNIFGSIFGKDETKESISKTQQTPTSWYYEEESSQMMEV